MPNDHGSPDTLLELSAREGDLLPAVILSPTWPTVPVPPGLTLAPFATRGYVRDGTTLRYVEQPAHALTVGSSDGQYWLALHHDTATAVSGWARSPGTHYLLNSGASQPATPPGGLIFAAVLVAGAVITTVTPLPVVMGNPPAWRAHLGLGTLAMQNADAVAITGGTATLTSATVTGGNLGVSTGNLTVTNGAVGFSAAPIPGTALTVGPAPSQFGGVVGIQDAPQANRALNLVWVRASQYGIILRPQDSDTGGNPAIQFLNNASGGIGSITTTATATSYNTSSDMRLKRNIAPLTDSLALIAQLNPISHLWNADGSYAENFLAHELQRVLPYAVTGEPDAVHPDGRVNPQQVDASKIIPRLVGAVKELLAQVEALTVRVTTLEEALGL